MADIKHDAKNYLASIKAMVYLAKSQLEKGEATEVEKSLAKIDQKANELNLLLDRISKASD